MKRQQTLFSQFRNRRLEKQLRQIDVQLLTGIKQSTVSLIEAGLIQPTAAQAKLLNNVLEADIFVEMGNDMASS